MKQSSWASLLGRALITSALLGLGWPVAAAGVATAAASTSAGVATAAASTATAAPAHSVTRAAAPVSLHCQVTWKNANGGSWATGADWSTGAPPTAQQNACITRALEAPVVLSGVAAARSLIVGGPVGTAELEMNGATLSLGAGATIAPSGTVLVTGVATKLQVAGHAVLTNQGTLTVQYEGLELMGNLTNAPGGQMDLYGTAGWSKPSGAGSLDLVGPGTFINRGSVWIQQGGGIQAPYGNGTGAVVDNAGGFIANAGNVKVGPGATFIEGAGKVIGSGTGNYNNVLLTGGVLDLVGAGASTFQLMGASKVEGTVAPDQVLALFSSTQVATIGSLTNEGVIATQYDGVTLTVPRGSTLDNYGTVQAVHGNGLYIGGHMVNERAGTIDAAGGTFGLVGGAVLVNRGTISVTGAGSFQVPEVDLGPATFDNAGGAITNEGTFQVTNGTFVEGAGTETGTPIRLSASATLDLRGKGASVFEFNGGHLEGNIAPRQTVTILGSVTAPATFTNFGTLTARSASIILPRGGTFTNHGVFNSPPNTQELLVFGNLVNARGATFNLNGAGGYSGGIDLGRPGTSIYNRGLMLMATSFVGLLLPHQGFYNTGTILFGVDGGGWGGFGLHSEIQATGGYGDVVLDGVIDPLYADENVPAPPWPTTTKSITYQLVGGGGGNAGVFTISCAASIGSHWSLSCSNPHHPGHRLGYSGQAIFTATSSTTLDPTVTTLVSTEPIAGYGRAFTSHYGQPVTLTSTVTPEHGTAQPTGTVTFYDVTGVAEGIAVLGTVKLSNVDGVATAKLVTRSLPVGAHDIVAFYSGDAHSLPGTSKDYSQQVAPDATTLHLVTGPPPPFGRMATLSAVLGLSRQGPAAPSGEVVFYGQDGGQYLGAVPVSTVHGITRAVLRTTAILPGSDNVTAVYEGDTNYLTATSPTVTYVAAAPTT